MALLAFQLLWHGLLTWTRPYGSDEFEHLHAAWYLLQGAVPYRDFFEHHHGLFWYLLTPALRLWPDSVAALFASRAIVWIIFVATSALLVTAGRRFGGWSAGIWGAVIWTSIAPIQHSACEVRPDTLMTLFLLLSFLLALRSGPYNALGAGIAWGAAFLTLQKAVLFLPALAVFPLSALARDRRIGAARIGLILFGLSLPILGGTFALVAADALDDWWDWCIRFNRTAPAIHGSWFTRGLSPLVSAALETNTTAFVAMGAGLLMCMRRHADDSERKLEWAASALLFVLSMAATRRPFDQYAIPALTLPAILGGGLLASLQRRVRRRSWRNAVAFVLAASLLAQNRPQPWREQRALQARILQEERHDYVLSHSEPGDVVLQGHPAFNIFLPDASFFWFLPFDMPSRAASLGLPSGPSFREIVLSSRPSFISLESANYRGGDEDPHDAAWLTTQAGYRRIPRFRIYERVDAALEPERSEQPATSSE